MQLHPATAQPTSDAELANGARLLHGQYQIEAPLIAGGFGITYLARDSLDRQVVIKECFPAELCQRDTTGQVRPRSPAQLRSYKAVLRSFLREAHLLARAEHPNIVPVHQVFRENGTAYIAMDHLLGEDLLSLRETAPQRLTAPMLHACLLQALGALDALHGQGILHRDISPDNLIWTVDNRLMLIDFGAACHTPAEDLTISEDTVAVKDGYSPHELYAAGAIARACSDLYALGATMHYLLTGDPPPSGPERLAAVTRGEADPLHPPAETPAFWSTIAKALSVLPAERYQTAADWLADLRCSRPPGTSAAAPLPATQELPEPTSTAPALPEAADVLAQDVPTASASGARLSTRIADLVAQTNDGLTAGLPRVLRPAPAPEPKAHKLKRQFVDLFGQPVGDLHAWMADQDCIEPSAPLAAGSAGDATDDAPPEADRMQAKGGLGRFFGKRTRPRDSATAS
ncbi:serine/threonine protein kinase [Epibacterium sp. MM17-32]|uniref:serine/threonine protein kinase n=1 Tax=Epibacterium sp. MM17-32 TaxID=2917734 RepID=UPI001EF69705|nr:serine/threonine-protein kinase [Epibacterium sp. MM17-32]MCG7627908.1 serine/threonine protein kinase [Epibacterium sp. MM17-32]